jgi:hypothetical protein
MRRLRHRGGHEDPSVRRARREDIQVHQEAPDRINVPGRFEPGRKYTIFLPDDFSCNGRKYVRSVTSFTMPDLPPRVAFGEKGSVIERDSRQILNLSLTNVEELEVRTLRLPLLLVPAASSDPDFERVRDLVTTRYSALRDSLGNDPAFRFFLAEPAESRQAFHPRKPATRPRPSRSLSRSGRTGRRGPPWPSRRPVRAAAGRR